MRPDLIIVAAFALSALMLALLVFALYSGNSRPEAREPLHHAYEPFTIEISVRDR